MRTIFSRILRKSQLRHSLSPRYVFSLSRSVQYPYLSALFAIYYVPPPYIEEPIKFAQAHLHPRLVTVNYLYAFDPNAAVSIEPFLDIIGRHFKQPKEGLGNDEQPRGAHVADNLTSRSASLVVSGRHPPYKTPSFGTTNRRDGILRSEAELIFLQAAVSQKRSVPFSIMPRKSISRPGRNLGSCMASKLRVSQIRETCGAARRPWKVAVLCAVLCALPWRRFERAPQNAANVATLKATGEIHTADGAPVPGATLRLTNQDTQKVWISWSDESGKFEFPSLPPGHYKVEATQFGFQPATVDLQIASLPEPHFHLVLRVATLAELAAPRDLRAPAAESARQPASRAARANGGQNRHGQVPLTAAPAGEAAVSSSHQAFRTRLRRAWRAADSSRPT